MAIHDLFMKSPPKLGDVKLFVPPNYRETATWVPKLGDVFPDFSADSTDGHIDFHLWAEGQWSVIFGFPERRAGISETEAVSISVNRDELAHRGAQAMGLSPCTHGTNVAWRDTIERVFKLQVNFPMVADANKNVCEALGMTHPRAPIDQTIRKIMIVDPSLHLRWMAEYPSPVGRSMDEVLRVLDALQQYDTHELGAPMDWLPGDPGIVRPDMSTREASARYGSKMTALTSKIRTVIPNRNAV